MPASTNLLAATAPVGPAPMIKTSASDSTMSDRFLSRISFSLGDTLRNHKQNRSFLGMLSLLELKFLDGPAIFICHDCHHSNISPKFWSIPQTRRTGRSGGDPNAR